MSVISLLFFVLVGHGQGSAVNAPSPRACVHDRGAGTLTACLHRAASRGSRDLALSCSDSATSVAEEVDATDDDQPRSGSRKLSALDAAPPRQQAARLHAIGRALCASTRSPILRC